MFLVHSRKKAAEDLRLLAQIAATSGNGEYALECFMKMQELIYPDKVAEKQDFAAKSEAKFKALTDKFFAKKD
jgi:hypothetical protein